MATVDLSTSSAAVPSPFILTHRKTVFPDKREDVRGRKVFDMQGHEIGTIARLVLDTEKRHVRLMEVVCRTGFLGLSKRVVMIPVDAVVRIEPDALYIDHSREHAGKSQPCNPDQLDQHAVETICRHYGCAPFWDPAYVAPLFHAHHHTTMHLHHHHH